jgi:hypothetical protein
MADRHKPEDTPENRSMEMTSATELDGNAQVAADVAGWIAAKLGPACYDETDDLPAGLSWNAAGPAAEIVLEDGSRLIVTVQVKGA